MAQAKILIVVGGYALVAALYIAFSDAMLFALWPDHESHYLVGLWKGLGFVAVTSLGLYLLLRRVHLRESSRYRAFYENHHAAMLIVDPRDGALIDANPAAARFYGWPREELRRMRITDINALTPEEVRAEMQRAVEQKRNVFHFRHRLRGGEVRNVLVYSGPVEVEGRTLLFSVVHDDTERHRAIRLFKYRNRLYEMLSRTNRLVVRATSREELYTDVCRVAVEAGGFRFAWIGLAGGEGGLWAAARFGNDGGYLDDALALYCMPDRRGTGIAGLALRRGERVVSNDFLADDRTQPWHELARRAGVAAAAAFPIRLAGKVIGVFCLHAPKTDFFADAELATLEEMAGDVSFGLDSLARAHALRESEERLRLALESAGQGIYDLNVQTGEAKVTPEYAAMLGYDPDNFHETNAAWIERLHPDDRESVAAAYRDYIAGTSPDYRVEFRQRTATGGWKWILSVGRVVERDATGAPLRMLGTHTDITLLKAAEARYRQLFQDNPQPMYVFDTATRKFLAVNDAMVSHYGYAESEFLSMTIEDIRPPEEVARLRDFIERLDRDGITRAGIWRHRKKDGTPIDVEITFHALDFEGRRAGLVLANDITDRLRAEREREAAQIKFRALVEQSLVGVFMIEGDRIAYTNPRAAEILGYAQGELEGQSLLPLVADRDRQAVAREIERVITGEVAVGHVECTVLRKDGRQIVIGAQGTLANLPGNPTVIGVVQDITEKLQAEELGREHVVSLERAMMGTVSAVSQMMDLRDPYTSGHERRVGEIAAAIAGELGWDADRQRGLRVAGGVHDVGKITVPAEILAKPSRLSAIEFEIIKSHAEQGYSILKDIDFPWPVAEVARQHHERLDGSGYPRGLKGDAIIPEARVLAVADVVESMGSHRPYRPMLGIEIALEEIERNAGLLYCAEAAQACLRLFREKGYRIPD
jgi:PAS domain S-box-containing protein